MAPGNDLLVSFDVVSLFTQVQIEEALEVVVRRLQDDETLIERTPISAEDIHTLAAICLNTTYFQYRDDFYEHIEGPGHSLMFLYIK